MKTKIKNEFQNPDLIFGNENQKRKLKLKNRILKSIIYFISFLFLLSPPSASHPPPLATRGGDVAPLIVRGAVAFYMRLRG